MSMIALPADLSADRAAALLPQLRQRFQAQSDVAWVLDGSAVQRFDSAALALLLECRRLALGASTTLTVQNLPEGLHSMAHAYGVDTLLGLPAVATADSQDAQLLS